MAALKYSTPGIYRLASSRPRPALDVVRTDIAGFVGFAERGPLPSLDPADPNVPFDPATLAIKLTSWREFRENFGGIIDASYLAYAVQAFFANGGKTCYVVRVAGSNPAALPKSAALVIPAETTVRTDGATVTTAPDFRIEAASPGGWGNRITVQVWPINDILWKEADGAGNTVDRSTPRVAIAAKILPGLDPDQSDVDEVYQSVALTTRTIPNTLNATDINGRSKLIRIRLPVGATVDIAPITITKNASGKLSGGIDDLSLVTKADFTGGAADYRGLRVLEEVPEITILCAPDAVNTSGVAFVARPYKVVPDPCAAAAKVDDPAPPVVSNGLKASDTPEIYQSMVDQCRRLRNRVTVLDTVDGLEAAETALSVKGFGIPNACAPFAAVYYPWIAVPDSLPGEPSTRLVPPSGHMAGVYAAISNTVGVQHSPANVELENAVDLGKHLTDVQHGNLNDSGINAIRSVPGRGIRVMGGRSLASSYAELLAWRFIHVRRVFSWIEDSVLRSMQWAVFESNNFNLRTTITHSLNVFLERIWRTGGLKGSTPTQAYYVKCDDTNNPQSVIDAGQLLCQIGLAVAASMEFIEFDIRRDLSGMQVIES